MWFLAVLGGLSCNKDNLLIVNPPPYNRHIFLDTLIVDPTEVWLRIHTNDSSSSGKIQIYRDSTSIFSQKILSKDTTIIDAALLPGTTHSYKAYRLKNALRADSTGMLALRTMDTTSHDFVWQVDTLGDGNGSILNDVAVLNDTLSYTVGQIYIKDSTGYIDQDYYGLAIWNGTEWKLFHLHATGPTGVISNLGPQGVFAFSSTDVWFANGGVFHWDGSTVTPYWINNFPGNRNPILSPGQLAAKIWGTSSHNLYIVGTNGAIAHFDGFVWSKMESGTDVDLLDVWGSPDGSVVWACGYYHSHAGTYLLRNTGSGWQIVYEGTSTEFTISPDSLSGMYTSVYTTSNKRIVSGSPAGVYFAQASTHGEAKRSSFTSGYFPGFPRGLRGNNLNDLTIVGAYNFIAHYNGVSWHYFSQLQDQNSELLRVDQRGNLVVAVGLTLDPINSRGLVFRGRRN